MKKTKKGFTLVELLVVIAIIAIIAAVAVPVTIGQINKSKEKTANTEMTNLTDAINTSYGAFVAGTGESTFEATVFATISKTEYIEKFTIAEDGTTVLFEFKAAKALDKFEEPATRTFDLTFTVPADLEGVYTIGSTSITKGQIVG